MSSGERRPPRRPLTADDRAVWDAVSRTLRRGPSSSTPPKTVDESARANFQRTAPEKPAHGPFAQPDRALAPATASTLSAGTALPKPQGELTRLHGRTDIRLADDLPGEVGRPQAGLDRRTAERLRRGDRSPDARLDLHGMTADRAHKALDRFIARAVAEGLRCVLVITGKGGRRSPDDAPWLPEGRGVLRDAVPGWLRSGPHARRIVGLYRAHQRHGGAGALYIYLKKSR